MPSTKIFAKKKASAKALGAVLLAALALLLVAGVTTAATAAHHVTLTPISQFNLKCSITGCTAGEIESTSNAWLDAYTCVITATDVNYFEHCAVNVQPVPITGPLAITGTYCGPTFDFINEVDPWFYVQTTYVGSNVGILAMGELDIDGNCATGRYQWPYVIPPGTTFLGADLRLDFHGEWVGSVFTMSWDSPSFVTTPVPTPTPTATPGPTAVTFINTQTVLNTSSGVLATFGPFVETVLGLVVGVLGVRMLISRVSTLGK